MGVCVGIQEGKKKKKVSDALALELQEAVSHQIGVLRTELRSSKRVVCVRYHGTMSLVHNRGHS